MKQECQEVDNDILEFEAESVGLTLNQYLEFDRLKTENARLKKSKAKKMFGITFFIFLSVFVATVGMYIWIYTFKPYYRYDKVVQGSNSHLIRTNLTTGKPEKFNNLTLEWEDGELLEAKKQSQAQNTKPWTAEDVARRRKELGIGG